MKTPLATVGSYQKSGTSLYHVSFNTIISNDSEGAVDSTPTSLLLDRWISDFLEEADVRRRTEELP
jgi:hypothetical protein